MLELPPELTAVISASSRPPPESFFTFSAGLFSIIRDEHSSGGEEVDRVCFDYSGDPGVFWLFK